MDLALDRTGNIYVSDWGRAMCVKVFSPEGKLVRTIGKVGGRPWIGAYDHNGMLLPNGIAMDRKDRLWVVEFDPCPRRTSVWKSTGQFEREFISAYSYAGTNCWISPSNPRRAIAQSAEFELDWKKGQYRTVATLWRPMKKNAYFGLYPDFYGHEEFEINGRKLLASHLTGSTFVVSERKGDRHQPLAAVGNVSRFLTGVLSLAGRAFNGLRFTRMPDLFADHLYFSPLLNTYLQEKHPEYFDGSFGNPAHIIGKNLIEIFDRSGVRSRFKAAYPYRFPTTNFTWADRNGDGLVQEREMTFFEVPGTEPYGFYTGWRAGVGPDLTLYQAVSMSKRLIVWKMPVTGWTECGAPIYDGPNAELIVDDKDHGFSNSQWADSKGNLLSNSTGGMMMFSPDGRKLWSYPNPYAGVHASHKAPQSRRGMLVGPLYVIGSAQTEGLGEVFVHNGNFGQAFIMTTDGLFVASMFRDSRSAPDDMPAKAVRGASHRETTMNAEWFGGQFFRNPLDGKLYLAGEHHGAGGTCVYELTGLDEARRIAPRPVVFDQTAFVEAQKLQAAREVQPAEQAGLLEVVMQQLEAPASIDAVAEEYKKERRYQARFSHDGRHSAVARVAYDMNNLYLFFQVRDDSPLKNLAGFGITELFKSGDCVLFELGAERDAEDTSPKPQPGDIRLLIAKVKDRHAAVMYRYVAPGSKDWIEITSGLGTLRVEQFRELKNVEIATKQTAAGYILEAAIPLADLNFSPQAGTAYRGDFAVIYSDKAGTKNTLRMHWATRKTALVSDAFNEAQIQPDQWGTIRVEAISKQ